MSNVLLLQLLIYTVTYAAGSQKWLKKSQNGTRVWASSLLAIFTTTPLIHIVINIGKFEKKKNLLTNKLSRMYYKIVSPSLFFKNLLLSS